MAFVEEKSAQKSDANYPGYMACESGKQLLNVDTAKQMDQSSLDVLEEELSRQTIEANSHDRPSEGTVSLSVIKTQDTLSPTPMHASLNSEASYLEATSHQLTRPTNTSDQLPSTSQCFILSPPPTSYNATSYQTDLITHMSSDQYRNIEMPTISQDLPPAFDTIHLPPAFDMIDVSAFGMVDQPPAYDKQNAPPAYEVAIGSTSTLGHHSAHPDDHFHAEPGNTELCIEEFPTKHRTLFKREIIASCFVTWFCGIIFGVVAFILALLAEQRASSGRYREAVKFGKASLSISIIGGFITLTVLLISIPFIVSSFHHGDAN